MVEGREFALHRAMLWARSAWFRALLGERWRRDTRRVEVSVMSAATFEVLTEFLYTECVPVPLTLLMRGASVHALSLSVPLSAVNHECEKPRI